MVINYLFLLKCLFQSDPYDVYIFVQILDYITACRLLSCFATSHLLDYQWPLICQNHLLISLLQIMDFNVFSLYEQTLAGQLCYGLIPDGQTNYYSCCGFTPLPVPSVNGQGATARCLDNGTVFRNAACMPSPPPPSPSPPPKSAVVLKQHFASAASMMAAIAAVVVMTAIV